MSYRRFIIESSAVQDGFASFDGDIYHHMVRVLRLGTGDMVELTDEKGNIHTGIINQVSKEWVAVKIEATYVPPVIEQLVPRITICQALPKGEKIDLILQKGTELGAHDFIIFNGQRSIAKVREDQLHRKLERWNRITTEAARQCGRSDIPCVSWFSSAADVAGSVTQDLRLLLWENEREKYLKQVFSECPRPSAIAIAIGPEGGFEPQEVDCFKQHEFIPVTLGTRILRTETASLAILSIMQYTWDGM